MRSVLITGASRGIGAAAATAFARAGCRVMINYCSSTDKAEELCDRLRKGGSEVYTIQADVSRPDEVRKMFFQAEKLCGGTDILINNAGIAQTKLFTDITDEDWNRMISVNLSSAFYCCREALPHMIRQHFGRIINVSSMWGQIGGSCEVHYSAAKAGLIGLTKALAMEEGLSGITVNCVAPGVIETDMISHLSSEDKKALMEETPTGSLGTPEDIAGAMLFLASDSSSFITGQVIGVNGGFVV